MAADEKRFWFYSGRSAQRLAATKAAGVPGAKALSREDVKKKRVSIPKAWIGSEGTWDWVVVAPPEPEPEPEA